MHSTDTGDLPYAPAVPSMLDLVRMSPKRLFPPGGEDLYRQIALLTEMRPGLEVLDVAAGKGVPLEYFVTEFGITGSGVEIDPAMVEAAEAWSRELRAGDRLQFQAGRSDRLPYRDDIFDITIGEIALANHCDPEAAVRELVRVTKPGGFVVLVQLVWKAPVDEDRRAVLSEHLGARPMMVVEWRRTLREAGVEDVHVENWSDEETSFRSEAVKPFADFAEIFSLGERISILRRAWQRWGLKGVSTALTRESEVHKLLTNERILGLDLLRGRKAGGPPAGEAAAVGTGHSVDASPDRDRGDGEAVRPDDETAPPDVDVARSTGGDADLAPDPDRDVVPEEANDQPETAGLPLFGDGAAPGDESSP